MVSSILDLKIQPNHYEKSPLVTIKDVPVIANKIEMSSRPEGRLCFTCEMFTTYQILN